MAFLQITAMAVLFNNTDTVSWHSYLFYVLETHKAMDKSDYIVRAQIPQYDTHISRTSIDIGTCTSLSN